ncbi:sterol desaturase family protein [Niabella pedocola]|uniref:Sterol desaturase family protein n=1 Tax=Niabella pedocola TaxID=1752077 RepID=A0ABS8PJV9_9BACT|nr:sterol desaturase family protein [Niabella pedocola]MCD2421359.1 sterol desaturase family protein [Niabella pedocola]
MHYKIEKPRKLTRDILVSVGLYLLPVALMLFYFYVADEKPWQQSTAENLRIMRENIPSWLQSTFTHLRKWGLIVLAIVVGIIEVIAGLYENRRWTRNEKILDLVCFVAPKILFIPVLTFFSLKLLPLLLPDVKNLFVWVPFWWGALIIAVADDLTQYWYHRLHHQVPFLWRFHRTHHSAPYMGMSMASRQNIIYTIFFSQIYLIAILTYLGLGLPALFVGGVKSLITLSAHSSIKWDRPFYTNRWLHPVGWVLERLISTPATHHAHHADTTDDGIGHYKGNFGNMFFIWDLIFGTGIITRKYPETYGIKSYQEEEWYAQFLWPVFKSKKQGSELAKGGPVVAEEPRP